MLRHALIRFTFKGTPANFLPLSSHHPWARVNLLRKIPIRTKTTKPVVPRTYKSHHKAPPSSPWKQEFEETQHESSSSIARRFRRIADRSVGFTYSVLTWALGAIVMICFIHTHVIAYGITLGPSMLPTIPYKGGGVFVSLLHRRGRWVKVGDCVSFAHPVRAEYNLIKRVIGMPGDFVLCDTPPDGREMVHGVQHSDLHVLGQGPHFDEVMAMRAAARSREQRLFRVPEGHCWVVGDNLNASRDSRNFGAVPLALIRGKVIAVIDGSKKSRLLRNPLEDATL